MSDAYVWIDPARRSGEPCIGGTRVPVYMVVEMVWANGVTVAEETWCLSRAQVLVACWYAGAGFPVQLHGRGGYQTRFPAVWRRRWRTWAEQVAGDLWAASGVYCDAIPDPPSYPTGEST